MEHAAVPAVESMRCSFVTVPLLLHAASMDSKKKMQRAGMPW
jgi:hypothetical protein